MEMGSAALALNTIGRTVKGRAVLTDVSLTVRAGQAVGIAGVNGAGKSSLLHCVMGLVRLSAGSIQLFGRPHEQAGARQGVAFLPERFMPPMHLNAHEVLVWLAGLRGQVWQPAQTRQALTEFGLDPIVMRRPLRHFSKGMTQKIGLLATLLSGAQLVLLDEPMSGLDPQARRFVMDALLAAKQHGRTLVFSSHALPQFEPLCDQMVVLHQGRLRFVGPPAELRRQHGGVALEDAFFAAIATEEAPCQG